MERNHLLVRVWGMGHEMGAETGPAVAVGEAAFTSGLDFERFFRQSVDRVHRALFLALGEADLAEEATAEAMARAFQHWRKVSRYESPAGWAYRVGLNWAISRQRRRRFRSDGPVPDVGTFDPSPLDADLALAVASLRPAHREVLVLRYFLDLDQRQIGEALGVPVGTVKSRLGRALDALRGEATDD